MKKTGIKILLVVYCLFLILSTSAQENDNDQDTFRSSFVALPLIFRTPETSWGFGAGAFYAFKFKGQSTTTRPSQFQVGGAYTLLNQLLLYFPYQIFTDNNRFQFTGELGYYRFVFDFYGIGNEQPADFREVFTVAFPRVKFQSLYGFKEKQFIGFRYWMDNFRLLELDPMGQLAQGTISGSEGGFLSGLGLVYQLDSRNSIFSSTEGWFSELVVFYNSRTLGSDFNYIKQQFDIRYFHPLNSNMSIALQGYAEVNTGDVPFNQLALLGGTKKLRGYYEGRYRDNHFLMLQSELRYALFWRFHGVFFFGAGVVADKFSTFNVSNIRPSIGTGLRFALNEQERIFLRLDYAIGYNSSGFYLTVGEAF